MSRFLVDTMCGRLPPYLRLCGHDTVYAADRDVEADNALLAIASAEDRTILTRDRQLADRADAAILLTERKTRAQLSELAAAAVDLTPTETPRRCGRCNGSVEAATENQDEVPEYVPDELSGRGEATALWRCRSCEQYFWKGGHWERMVETLDSAR